MGYNFVSIMNHREIFFRHLAQTSRGPLALRIERAEGIYLYGDGKRYTDCISGISVSNTGHSNEAVMRAVKNQLDKHTHLMVYGELIQDAQTALANRLISVLPEKLDCVYLLNSGSEAVEAAMKLAKKVTGRHRFAAINKAYHGSTQGALSLMSEQEFSRPFAPLLPGVSFIDQNQSEQIHGAVTDETAAVFVEPVMGEKGYIPCEKVFLQNLRSRCDETGTLLVFDEIQTAFGRTGKLFGFEHSGVVPDILLLAKSFGGGLPLGGVVASRELLGAFSENPVLGHITTFGGHPLSCAAAAASLEYLLEHSLHNHAAAMEAVFRKHLKHPEIWRIDGTGLMLSLQLRDEIFCRNVIDMCVEAGLLIDWFLFAPDKIRIAPPLIINEMQIEEICGTILEKIELACATYGRSSV